MLAKNQILKQVPWDSIIDLADSLSETGMQDAEVAKEIADFLDMVLDFKMIVKGPAGEFLEAIDGHVLLSAITIILKVSKNGKEQRKAKRLAKMKTIASISETIPVKK